MDLSKLPTHLSPHLLVVTFITNMILFGSFYFDSPSTIVADLGSTVFVLSTFAVMIVSFILAIISIFVNLCNDKVLVYKRWRVAQFILIPFNLVYMAGISIPYSFELISILDKI